MDIATADFTSSDWVAVTADVDESDVGELSLTNNQIMMHSSTGNLYRYVGASGNVDVFAFTSAIRVDADSWARVLLGTTVTGETRFTDLEADLTVAGRRRP